MSDLTEAEARSEAAAIAARRPEVIVTSPDLTGPEFYISIWRSLAEHFVRNGFPGFGDRMPRSLIQDCGLQVAESLFRAANAVEWHLDAQREIAYAEAHDDATLLACDEDVVA